jgi:hypothetical protein
LGNAVATSGSAAQTQADTKPIATALVRLTTMCFMAHSDSIKEIPMPATRTARKHSARPLEHAAKAEFTPADHRSQSQPLSLQTGSVTPRKIAVALSAPTFFVIGASALTGR